MGIASKCNLEKTSDGEFLAGLKSKQQDKNWTIDEIYEVERRGFEFLTSDPELSTELLMIRDSKAAELQATFKPALESLRKIAEDYEKYQDLLSRALEPTFKVMRAFQTNAEKFSKLAQIIGPEYEPTMTSLRGITGPLPQKFSEIKVNEEKVVVALLETTVNDISKLVEETVAVKKFYKRDFVFWSIFVVNVVTMGATVWMLCLATQGHA